MALLEDLLERIAKHDKKQTEAVDIWYDEKETGRNTNNKIIAWTKELETELYELMVPIRLGKTSGDNLVDYVIRTELKIPNRDIVATCKKLINFRTGLEIYKGKYILYVQPRMHQTHMLGKINITPVIIIEENSLSINTNNRYAKHKYVDGDHHIDLYKKNMPLFTDELDYYAPTKDGLKIQNSTWKSLIKCLNKA
ncbi:MAG: hypothetical protein AABW84_02520 [Nanoarchaeota archaeon]|mgnify:CR=1 FL=1